MLVQVQLAAFSGGVEQFSRRPHKPKTVGAIPISATAATVPNTVANHVPIKGATVIPCVKTGSIGGSKSASQLHNLGPVKTPTQNVLASGTGVRFPKPRRVGSTPSEDTRIPAPERF